MTPYQKIMRAYNDPRGVRGLRLTADDVAALGQDSAIEAVAGNDDLNDCARRGHRIKRGEKTCFCGEQGCAPPERWDGVMRWR